MNDINLERVVSFGGLQAFDILWEGYRIHGSRSLCLSLLEGASHHFWYRLCGLDQGGPLYEQFEHAYKVNDLVRFFVDAIQTHLCADCDEWHAVCIGISRAEREIDCYRPERRDAHSWMTSETAINIGHERSGLLMKDKYEAN